MLNSTTNFLWNLILFGLAFTQSASAWYLIGKSSPTIDFNRRTHIFLTSRGNDLNGNPAMAALASQARVQQNHPQDQFVFIITVKDESEATNFIQMGIPHPQLVREHLVHINLNNFLFEFNKISSLHYFGHGGVAAGMFLDKFEMNGLDIDVRYNYDLLPKNLKSHFTKDAYVKLNACNQGQLLAPRMSEIFGVPVAAATTGTHFEVIHSDGNFYWAEDSGPLKSKTYWNPQWRKSSQVMFRMKPNFFSHTHHEKGQPNIQFNRGLPFYKVFCGLSSDEDCKKRMAKILIDSPTLPKVDIQSSLESFKAAAREWLCPSNRWGNRSQFDCINYLKKNFDQESPSEAVKTYMPFSGTPSICDSKSCFTFAREAECLSDPWSTWQCLIRPLSSQDKRVSSALFDEYQALIEGFRLLQKNGL